MQEALLDVPALVRERGTLVKRRAMEKENWCSAVLVRGLPAAERNLESFGSYIAAASIATPETMTAVSIHVCPSKEQAAYLRRLVDVLTRELIGQAFVFGGDFNAARNYDHVHHRKLYRPVFAALADRFHDCHWALHGREKQSVWRSKTKGEFQDDHIFVPKVWGPKVRHCNVVDNDYVRQLSDHGPVVLDLDLGT